MSSSRSGKRKGFQASWEISFGQPVNMPNHVRLAAGGSTCTQPAAQSSKNSERLMEARRDLIVHRLTSGCKWQAEFFPKLSKNVTRTTLPSATTAGQFCER